MAFIQQTAPDTVTPFNRPNGNQDRTPAAGFINMFLPSKKGNGARRKLGSIALYNDKNQHEADLVNWLIEDPSRIEIIASRLMLEFNPNTVDETAGFDLD